MSTSSYPPNFTLVARPYATSDGTLYLSYGSFFRTDVPSSQYSDFGSQVFAYAIGSIVFIVIWTAQGKGFFWPIYPLLVWGLGVSVQHFTVVIRGQITEEDVRRKMNRNGGNMEV